MISVNMSVREAISLLTGGEITNELCEQIIKAIEEKCGSLAAATGNLSLTVRNFPTDNRIRVIKTIKFAMGWGLRESKEFCDVVSGPWDLVSNTYSGGKPNTLSHNKDVIERLNKELLNLGCVTHID